MSQADMPAPTPPVGRSRFRRTMEFARYGRFCCCCICLNPEEAQRARRVFRLAQRVARDQ